jgi:hypothetical protein
MTMQSKCASHLQKCVGVFFSILFLCFPSTLFAAFPVTISPAVVDGEAKAREILRYKVTITNNTKQMVTLYPWARDVDQIGEDTKTQGLDPTTSLLAWLQFSRAELIVQAGESVELPILVQVNLRALPGNYHAVFRVSDGPNRMEAEHDQSRTTSIPINVRILDDANEHLQLGLFSTKKNLFMGDTATFGYRLDNTGNRGIVPTGKIRIFDRKGEEVEVVDVNMTHDKIEPDSKRQLASVWQSGDHFGKYKAMLDVSYGKTGTIQDTVFFWVLPWKKLLSFFLTLAIACTIVALLIHSYTASGGRKLAVIRERFTDDEEDVPNIVEDVERVSLYARVKKMWQREKGLREVESLEKSAYVDALKEVPPPAPQRTRYMVTHPETTERVHLSPRVKKQHVDPAHVVHLRKS